MQNQIQVFENKEFGEIRTVEIDGQVWFIGKDVAEILGYERPTKAVQDHVDGEDKDVVPIQDSIGRRQNTPVINESGLYSLILSSKLPAAKAFKRWVIAEVLPVLRKTGGYVGNDELFINTYLPFADENTKSLFSATLLTIRQLNNQIEVMKPKAEFFDAVADSSDAIDIGSAAKVLNMGIGRNRLFELMRNESILMSNNQPYQSYIDRGYFRTVEQKYSKPDGSTHIYIKTLVYQKGLDYIRKIVATQVPTYEKEGA